MNTKPDHVRHTLTHLAVLEMAITVYQRLAASYLADPTSTEITRQLAAATSTLQSMIPEVMDSIAHDYLQEQDHVTNTSPTPDEEAAYTAYLDSRERELDSMYAPERFDTSAD